MLNKLHYKKLAFIEPIQVFLQVADRSSVIFLDSSKIDENYGRYSFIMFEPLVSYVAKNPEFKTSNHDNIIVYDNLEEAINSWQNIFRQNQHATNPDLPPFSGGLAGYFSYDLSKQLENIEPTTKSIIPNYILGLYNKVFAFDHIKQECFIFVNEVYGFEVNVENELQYLSSFLDKAATNKYNPISRDLPFVDVSSNFTKEEYFAIFKKSQEYILSGDIYEVNLAQCFSGKISQNYPKIDLYQKLRHINSAPFAAYLDLSKIAGFEYQILSASPERFLSVRQRYVEARPIKGTIRSSNVLKEDKALIEELACSEKDRAENIMIVDLLRNDLGKICKVGSIKVSQLCKIESFTNLHHMVSVINGELKEDKSIFDIITAAFPGGSVTGAPKIRAMQIIEELEQTSRGVYCGSIGYFGFNGNVDLNIAIRTISLENDWLKFYSGGAITLDSEANSEYEESSLKAEKINEVIN